MEYKEFTADDAVDLYNRAEIIDDTKTIDLSAYAYLPFDVARAWLIFAENDSIELSIKSEQRVLGENGEAEAFSQITFLLGKELSGDIALTHAFYLTQSESQYIEFPVTLPENVLVIDTSQTEENKQEISLQIPIVQIPFDISEVFIYTCSLYGKIELAEQEFWAVDSEDISFAITDVRNITVSNRLL